MSYASHPQHHWSCMVSLILALATNLVAPRALAAPIDEFRLSDIEQKIRDLETLTREHSRQLSVLSGQSLSAGSRNAATSSTATSGRELRWINAASWNSIRPGMSELQVVELLGPPTQMRIADDNQSRQLLYALEIGRSGYLSGRITFSKGLVTGIETPALK